MAGARDQAARMLRPEPDAAEGESARDALAESLRAHVSEETVARQPAETPANPSIDKPAIEKPAGAPAPGAEQAAPKSGKRKLVLMGIVGLLALAAASYGTHYVLVGRFYISTD